jgi:hypothetical protein
MGSSIEFIMAECAEKQFIDYLNLNGIKIISPTSMTSCPEVIGKFYSEGENIFWKKAYLARPEDVCGIKMFRVKSCGHFIIEDTYKAPVIELRRGIGNRKSNARLSAELYYFKEGVKTYKGSDFEGLYKKIETWIKINYSVIEPDSILFGCC